MTCTRAYSLVARVDIARELLSCRRGPVVELSRTEFIGRNDFAAGHGGEQRKVTGSWYASLFNCAGPKYAVVQAAVSMRSVRPQRTNIWTLWPCSRTLGWRVRDER